MRSVLYFGANVVYPSRSGGGSILSPGPFQQIAGVRWSDILGLRSAGNVVFAVKGGSRVTFFFPLCIPMMLAGRVVQIVRAQLFMRSAGGPGDVHTQLDCVSLYNKFGSALFHHQFPPGSPVSDTIVQFVDPARSLGPVLGPVQLAAEIVFGQDQIVSFSGGSISIDTVD